MRLVRSLLVATTALAVSASLVSTASAAKPSKPSGSVTATVVAPPRVTPTTFGFGVQASTDTKGLGGWMQRSGAAWDYAYRYLGGGVGRTVNWTNWEPNATYPVSYATNASSKGYTPVFSYYQMLYGGAPCS